ncbi:glycosyltransferase [Variovorax sp.]|uniref:glycosyltransferase n=1 Tax=Variovorax sp. TaxID=1871043 RepID=UPI002D63EB4A|nr:glycosyltransferase [Variovorax sp.]HYP83362.1 glycosyltransferase [Variovorax sp.]
MLGIAIPAHNEERSIGHAVAAARQAARHAGLAGESFEIIVALDACRDATGAEAVAAGARTIELSARNVGHARAAAARELLGLGARWLAFTDADSRADPDWLVHQLAQDAHAVCGCVSVDDWSAHGAHAAKVKAHFLSTYRAREGHGHIHGANLGVSAHAYARAGGFKPLACSEDVALVQALQSSGTRVAWSARPRVFTSARRHGRVTGGFADALREGPAAAAERDAGAHARGA